MGIKKVRPWVLQRGALLGKGTEDGKNPLVGTYVHPKQLLEAMHDQMGLEGVAEHKGIFIRDNGSELGAIRHRYSRVYWHDRKLRNHKNGENVTIALVNELSRRYLNWQNKLIREVYGPETVITQVDDGIMRTSTKMQEMAKRSASGGTRKKKVVIAGQPIEKFVCSLAGRGRPVDKKDDFIISITGKQEADRILDELVAAGQKYREDKEPNPEARIEEPKSTEDVKEFKQAVALVGKVDVRHVAVITEDTDFGCTNTAETFGFVCAMQCRGLNAKLELDVTDKWQEDGKDEDPQDGDDKKDGDDKTMGGGAKKSASSGAAGTGLAGAQTSETGGTSTRRRVQKKKKSWRNPAVSRNGDKFLPRPALRAMLWSASGLDSILGPDRGRRLRIVVLVGSDYSGDGLFGFTWSLVESGIAKDVYNEPWTTAEELQQRLQTLVDRLASQKAADVAWRASGAAGTVRKPSHQVDVSVKFAQTLIDAVKTFELDQSIQLVDRSTPSSMIDFRLTFDPPLAPDRQRTTGGPDATNTTNASGGAGAPGTSGRIARGSAGSPIAGRRRRSGQGRRREGASSGGESSEGGDERVSDNGNEAAAGDGDEAMKEPATGGAPAHKAAGAAPTAVDDAPGCVRPPHPLRPEANEFIMRDGKQHHPEHPFARPDGARAHKPSRLRHCPLPLDCSVVLAAEAYGPEPVLAEYVYGEEIEAVDVDGTARDQDKDEDEDQASETGSDDDGDGDSDRKATASGRRPRLKDVFEVVSSWAVPLDGAFRVLCSRATTSTGADGGKVRAEATPRRPYGRNGRERARTKRLREKGWASYPGSRRTASVKPLVAQDDPVEKDAPVPSLQAASPHGASVHPTSPAAAASRSPSSSPHAPSSPDPKERYPAHEFPQHQSRAPAKLVRLFHFAAVMQNATVMAAQKEYIVAQVLKSSDKGYKVLGENAVERHGVARVMAKLKAEAQRGRHGTVATKTPAEVTAAARRAVEAGHYRPTFMGGEDVDAEIYKPFATVYKEDLTTKPIELERLGNFLASNLLANFPVALEGVLRTSHRTLEVPSIVADAFKDASPEAQVDFAVAIRPILVNLLVDTPFSRASAEAGRDDAAPPQVGEQRRSARGVAQQGQRARELAVEAPPLTLTQDDQKALREAVRRIYDESKFIHACDSLVIDVMKRLLAQRDVAFANGLNVQFLTAEEQRVIRAKYPSAASFARKADARFDQNMAKAYVSAAGLTGDGDEAWDRIKSQSFAEMFDGLPEKAKLRSAALILWTRLARGEHDKVLPSFSPKYINMNVMGLFRVWQRANLRRFINELEALATSIYRDLARKMHKNGVESALLKDLRQLFKPSRSNWVALRASADVSAVELTVPPGLEAELNDIYETLQDAFGLMNLSLSKTALSSVALGGGQVELLHALVRQDKLPRNFIATAAFRVSASDIIFTGVRQDLLRKKARGEKATGEELTAGEYFKELVAPLDWTQMRPSFYPDYTGVTEYVGDPRTGELVTRQVIPFTFDGCTEAQHAQQDRPAPFRPRGAPRLRAGFAERHPATTTIELKRRTRTDKTRDGFPVNWAWAGGADDEKRRRLIAERSGTRHENIIEVGIDLGRVGPVAAFVSAGNVDSPSGRAESVIVMTRGALGQIDSETNRMRSNRSNWLGKGFKERMPLMDEEAAAMAASGGENGGNQSAAHPLYDHETMIMRAAVVGLVAANAGCSRQRRSRATLRKAYIQGSAAEFARAFVGGRNAPTSAEAHKKLVMLAVGSATPKREAGKGGGVDSSKTILRQIEVELQSWGVRSQIVMTNEAYTSQHCPRPWCVDDERRRSLVVHPKRADKSECLRISYCPRCHGVFHRDGGAASNILAMLKCWLVHGKWLWRRDGGVEEECLNGEEKC